MFDQRKKEPPHLALVLGSGGVRSIASVGIVDVLAAEGIRPDLIVGCSSGALFGATLALGLSSREALHMATSLWSAELTQQHRWRAYAQLLAPRWFGFDAGFALRDDRGIEQRIRRAFGEQRLEDLPTPLRVVATEARSGERVVLRHGALVQALRASIAVPLIFPSVEVEGRRLVDGVVSDPLPVAVAGDAAVVLTLGFKGAMPRRIDRASRLVAQASTALINNLQQARIDAARNAGQRVFAIELGLDRHVGLWETRAMPHLFEAGRQAARAQLAQIKALLREVAAHQQHRQPPQAFDFGPIAA
ncbi:MAG: patatin-like phospholipase family protein [Rubrivivax sp.]|nr:patatin-like phospholipase family protein [Rubrivivax sp.]